MENQNNLENSVNSNPAGDANIVGRKGTSKGSGKGNRWKTYFMKAVPFLLVGIICFSLGFGLDRILMKKRTKKLLREKPGVNEKIKKNQDKTPRDKAGKKTI